MIKYTAEGFTLFMLENISEVRDRLESSRNSPLQAMAMAGNPMTSAALVAAWCWFESVMRSDGIEEKHALYPLTLVAYAFDSPDIRKSYGELNDVAVVQDLAPKALNMFLDTRPDLDIDAALEALNS